LFQSDNRAGAVVGGESNVWFWIGTHGKDDMLVGINEKQDGTFRTNRMMSTCEGTGDFAFEFIDAGNPL